VTRFIMALLAVSAAAPVLAQHAGHGAEQPPPETARPGSRDPPPTAFSGPAHAADTLFGPEEMADAREQMSAEHGDITTSLILADRFEARAGSGQEDYLWDVQGWYGGDVHKIWLKTEGEASPGDSPEKAELQVLYSRAVRPFLDLQAGVRHDLSPDPERSHLVIGLQGLVPYSFELDAAAFLSDEGDLTGRLKGELDLQLGQRSILQPRAELNLAAQDVPELGIGSGVSSIEAGLRLRYEIRREFAPYLGIGWERMLGDTRDFARVAGEDSGGWKAVVGVRAWF
jgi:copper resistance protein B